MAVKVWKDVEVKGDEMDRAFARAGIKVVADANSYGNVTNIEIAVNGVSFRFASDYGMKVQRPAPETKTAHLLRGSCAGLAIDERFDDFDGAHKRKEELEPILRDGESLDIKTVDVEVSE